MKTSLKIVLFGYMGSGKSSVGGELASVIQYTFEDLDTEIEKREGCSIPELFQTKGEIYFRKKENALIKQLVNSEEKLVIATGGGTPCYGDTLAFLLKQDHVIIVYLKASLDTLTHRLFDEKLKRPLLSHLESENEMKDFVRKHLFERAHFYNQATFVIDTDHASVSEIIEKIVVKLF